MSENMKCCPRCGKIGYGITTNGCGGCPNDFTYHVGFGIKEPAPVEASIGSTDAKNVSIKCEKIGISPVEAKRVSQAVINLYLSESVRGEAPRIIRQQQKDIAELKAECLPWLEKYYNGKCESLAEELKVGQLLTKLQARG